MSFRYSLMLGIGLVLSLLFQGTATSPQQPYTPTKFIFIERYKFPVPPIPAPVVKTGLATAYCNCKDRMNGETGITASGYKLDNGITYKGFRILASDKKYPLGTLVDIKLESGETIHGIVLDRGGAVRGNHFDIVYTSRSRAYDFGRQDITFEIKGRLDI